MIKVAEHVTISKLKDPTPKVIRQRCLRIQSGWSRRERRIRAGVNLSPRWTATIHPDSTFSEPMNA